MRPVGLYRQGPVAVRFPVTRLGRGKNTSLAEGLPRRAGFAIEHIHENQFMRVGTQVPKV